MLDCLAQGLGEQAVCEQTGLDAKSVALAIGDLRALRLVDESLRPSMAPVARPASQASISHNSVSHIQTAADNDSLPPGIEPWTGEPMPSGSTAPEGLSPDTPIPEAFLSQPPSSSPKPRNSSVPPGSRALPSEALNYRKLYEQRFRDFTVEQRIEAALHAQQGDLLALCLDSSPRVISSLLDNPQFALDHARTVAAHHSTPQGLEQLARRGQFLRDAHVVRRLLQNNQLPDGVLLRALSGRRLLEVYRAGINRDLPERNRNRVRAQLRISFTRTEPDERAALVLKTEGRCLAQLHGCTFDGKTTQRLCNHNYSSTLLIQNLARFAATPPALLHKLLRCGPVRRQPQLRAAVLRHPNCSGSLRHNSDK